MTVDNAILRTDSYKLSHYLQYPPGTTEVSAYIEARPGARFNDVTFFGLQMFLQNELSRGVDDDDIAEAERFTAQHIPGLTFNREGWRIIVDEYNGKLPIEIQALAEGMTVPVGTPLVQVRNTDPRLPWLTTYIETALLRAVWYPSTVATVSREAKKVIYAGLKKSSDDADGQIPFKLHDFGARGVTCAEQAAIGGAAHLVNFMGSDTIEGVVAANRSYQAGMAAFSIPAAEHSTITSWGRDGEIAAYRNMLEQFGGEGRIVAVVSDSYDIFNAVRNIWGDRLKSDVIRMGGTLVIRPDSGDPVETPVRVLKDLDAAFGSSRNSRGFKVLNPAVRIIQGDGMNIDSIAALVRAVIDAGFSIDNIAFGMGGGLLQQVNRDTMKFAMKANEIVVNGERRDVSKAPIGDPGKASKAGRLAVTRRGSRGTFVTVRESDLARGESLLQPVFRNGEILQTWTFDEVRKHAALASDDAARAM